MKLFCECNSEWIYRTNDIPIISRRIIQNNYCKDRINKNNFNLNCDDCGYFPWYDADHENMMFDIKNMNS